MVNWKGFFSQKFVVTAGVRQGGCISPFLFNVMVDSVISAVHESGLGCHVDNLNFGILMYADDLILLSASPFHLQKMIDICINSLNDIDLSINIKKSVCVRIGKRSRYACPLVMINNVLIQWSDSVKFFGILFTSGTKLSVDFKSSRCKFFSSFNSIFSKIPKARESVIVALTKSKCTPSLLYGMEALKLNKSGLQRLDNPLYLALGKIFKTFDRNVLNNCMFFLSTLPPSLEYLVRKAKFLANLKESRNCLLHVLFNTCASTELDALFRGQQLVPDGNLYTFKRKVWKTFETLL